jgi:hypothetical protein
MNLDSNLSVITDSNPLSNVSPDTGTAFRFKESVAALAEIILTAHPSLPVLLRTIHSQIKKDPEVVTLLSEDEIGIIVNGLKRQTQVELVTTTVKPTSANAAIKKAVKAAGGNAVDLF